MNKANSRWSIIAAKRRYREEAKVMDKAIRQHGDLMERIISEAMRLEDDDHTGRQTH